MIHFIRVPILPSLLISLIVSIFLPLEARAQAFEDGERQEDAQKNEHEDEHEASRFYQALNLESVREAAALHSRAVSRANMALRMSSENERLGELLFAESEIKRARRLLPKDMNIHWASIEIVNILYSMSEPAALEARRAVYLDELLAFRALHPAINADTIAFSLAILAVKEARYEDAIREYQITLEKTRDVGTRQTTLANLGEAWMLAGNLERATETFEEALLHAEAHPISDRSMLLVLIGAAVAFDRLGDEERATAFAVKAREYGGGDLSVLRDPNVFYEPEGEIAIYDYMNAKGGIADAKNEYERVTAVRRALQALQTFLEIAKESPYREHAEARLEEISRALEAADSGRRAPARSSPRP